MADQYSAMSSGVETASHTGHYLKNLLNVQ